MNSCVIDQGHFDYPEDATTDLPVTASCHPVPGPESLDRGGGGEGVLYYKIQVTLRHNVTIDSRCTVEARKLEHGCPHTLKVKYKGS